MKFRLVHLGYRRTPDYPYDYRIELIEYDLEEQSRAAQWLNDQKIPHVTAGWKPGSVIYLKDRDAVLFALRWSS